MTAPAAGLGADYTAYELGPLEPATRAECAAFEAAIWFLMVGRGEPRYVKALTVHVPGVEVPCRGLCPVWPCLTFRLARESRDRHLGVHVPVQRA